MRNPLIKKKGNIKSEDFLLDQNINYYLMKI